MLEFGHTPRMLVGRTRGAKMKTDNHTLAPYTTVRPFIRCRIYVIELATFAKRYFQTTEANSTLTLSDIQVPTV